MQINFKLDVSRADYEQAVSPFASQFAAVAGLRWKIWLMDGAIFGRGGEGFVRLNFGCPRSMLTEALDRMKEALLALR